MNYYIALATSGGDNYEMGMYPYLDNPDTKIDAVCVIDEGGKEVTLDKAFNDPNATYIAWYGEFTWYALIKAGYLSNIEQWRSVDVWRVASGYNRHIERTPEDNRAIRGESGDEIRSKAIIIKEEVVRVKSTYEVLEANFKVFEPKWVEWHTHVKINARGVKIDKIFVERYTSEMTGLHNASRILFIEIFKTPNPTRLEVLEYVNSFGYIKLSNLNRSEIRRLLAFNLPTPKGKEEVEKVGRFAMLRSALELEDLSSDNTHLKLYDLKDYGYLRGAYCYYGTCTGRWTSLGINLHNRCRDGVGVPMDEGKKAIMTFDTEKFQELSRDKGRGWLLTCAFVPDGDNRVFFKIDYSQIEARILATLAGVDWKIEAFRNEQDIYKVTASKLFNCDAVAVTDEQRAFGKLTELALGYGGGVGVLTQKGVNYEVASRLVAEWRRVNANIVTLWSRMSRAYHHAYTNSTLAECAGIKMAKVREGVAIRLLSGRTILIKEAPQDTSGATITARVVQAMARDIHATAMCMLEASGYEVQLHTHDDVVVTLDHDGEYHYDNERIKEIESIMINAGRVLEFANGDVVPLQLKRDFANYYR